jgi:Phosphopantetheine attachment site/Anticodon binding domain of methionyl tRNA ligase
VRVHTYSAAALQGPDGVDSSYVDLGPAGQLGVGAAWARVAPGLRSVANQHDEIETWVVVAGEGLVFADAERLRVVAPTVVQFEPFETHFVESTGATDLVFASFYWRDGERARDAATGVEHRRFHERPVFVLSSGPSPAAEAFARYQRMTGAEAWHLAGGDDPGDDAGRRAFLDRVAASGQRDLRAGVEELLRLGRVPASARELAGRELVVTDESAAAAYDVLRSIEALGRRLGRDWRADAPRSDWKIVRFTDSKDALLRAVVQPALWRLAHPAWTPDVDYHVVEHQPAEAGPADHWQRWLMDLGARVEARYDGVVRDAGIWTPEQTAFLARLETRLAALTGSLGQDGFSLDQAAETLDGIVQDATSFARLQAPLAALETWRDEARTAVALELAAARLLAAGAAPLMPRFAAGLAAALGDSAPAGWPRRVTLVPPGTRVALARLGDRPDGPDEPPLLPWLAGLVRGVLRLPDDEAVGDRTLVALGMESLQAIALQYQILEQVGADVTIEDLLGSRDVAQLATFIASELPSEVVTARAGARP